MVVRTSLTPWEYHKQCHPDQVALRIFAAENIQNVLTWQELCERVDQYQACIASYGMKKGDVLTLVGKNHSETILWLLAAFQHGVMCALTMPQPVSQLLVKIDTLYTTEQIPFIWFSPDCEPMCEHLVSHGRPVTEITFHGQSQLIPEVVYDEQNLASIIFTSGSTGNPKAVAHEHSQHLASAKGLLEVFNFQLDHTWLLSLPVYHVSGLAIIYRWLQSGACLKVGCGNLFQDIGGVTHASLVPTQLKRLLDSKQTLTLTHVLLGGSHIPHSLSQQAAQLGIETWLGYGMTEAASTVTAKKVDETVTAGRLLPKRALKIEDDIIFVAGETLASGYFQQGEVQPLVGNDGWFNTKDLGKWKNDELVIIGRVDNLFISGGENVHCEEIEAVLNQHSDIRLAMVIPVLDEEFGARPVAIIQSEQFVTKQQCHSWCQDKLEKYKWPIACFEMPTSLTQTGIKVSRKALKEWFSSAQSDYTPSS